MALSMHLKIDCEIKLLFELNLCYITFFVLKKGSQEHNIKMMSQ